ncbi:hypothetical protein GCM10028857_12230 [Salinarchaeum chitinilyticum]
MIDALPLVFGFGRQELIANAGIAGGIAMGLAVLAMLLVSVLPAYSDSWAERLGTTDTTPSGPDPKEVIPGREEPITAPSTSRSAAPDASTVDADEENTAIPEPETAGEEQSADDEAEDVGRAEEARENAADQRDDENPAN